MGKNLQGAESESEPAGDGGVGRGWEEWGERLEGAGQGVVEGWSSVTDVSNQN